MDGINQRCNYILIIYLRMIQQMFEGLDFGCRTLTELHGSHLVKRLSHNHNHGFRRQPSLNPAPLLELTNHMVALGADPFHGRIIRIHLVQNSKAFRLFCIQNFLFVLVQIILTDQFPR